jgi:hypothetical protein
MTTGAWKRIVETMVATFASPTLTAVLRGGAGCYTSHSSARGLPVIPTAASAELARPGHRCECFRGDLRTPESTGAERAATCTKVLDAGNCA